MLQVQVQLCYYLAACIITHDEYTGLDPGRVDLVRLMAKRFYPILFIASSEQAEAAIIDLREINNNREACTASWAELWAELCNQEQGSTRRLLLAGIGVAFMQQASGIEAQVYYTPEILESAGMETMDQQLGGQAIVGVVKVRKRFCCVILLLHSFLLPCVRSMQH